MSRTEELKDLKSFISLHKKEIAKEILNPYGAQPRWREALAILKSVSILDDKMEYAINTLLKIALESVLREEPPKNTLKDLLDPL